MTDFNKQTLMDSESGMATYYNFNSNSFDLLVVTFGGVESTKTEDGFGTAFLLKQGIDNIYVAQEKFTQYQLLDREVLFESLQNILELYNKVIFYGTSLGGYCALYYGSRFNCQIIAFSPRNSAHPIINKSKWGKDFLHLDFSKIKSSSKSYVIYDPDVNHDQLYMDAQIIPAFKNLSIIKLPGYGHEIPRVFSELKLLSDILEIYFLHGIVEIPIHNVYESKTFLRRALNQELSNKSYSNVESLLFFYSKTFFDDNISIYLKYLADSDYFLNVKELSQYSREYEPKSFDKFINFCNKNPNITSGVLFRELALHYERVLDFPKASELMALALVKRSEGKFIISKNFYYDKILRNCYDKN